MTITDILTKVMEELRNADVVRVPMREAVDAIMDADDYDKVFAHSPNTNIVEDLTELLRTLEMRAHYGYTAVAYVMEDSEGFKNIMFFKFETLSRIPSISLTKPIRHLEQQQGEVIDGTAVRVTDDTGGVCLS
jgi:hypothetical protein